MSPLATIVWVFVILMDTSGQLILKKAAVDDIEGGGIERWKAMAGNIWLWTGILAYVFEFFVWMAFLSLVPLAMGVLLASFNIITVLVGGRIFFGEHVTKKRCLATALISIGVILVGWGS